jgi:hypothetical protein
MLTKQILRVRERGELDPAIDLMTQTCPERKSMQPPMRTLPLYLSISISSVSLDSLKVSDQGDLVSIMTLHCLCLTKHWPLTFKFELAFEGSSPNSITTTRYPNSLLLFGSSEDGGRGCHMQSHVG